MMISVRFVSSTPGSQSGAKMLRSAYRRVETALNGNLISCNRFHPARWLNLPEAYNPTFSQFSFITGPQGCFGKTMAVSEMKAVLA
jgi:hypothetical protein